MKNIENKLKPSIKLQLKKQRKEEDMRTHKRVYGQGTIQIDKKAGELSAIYTQKNKGWKTFESGVKPNWP